MTITAATINLLMDGSPPFRFDSSNLRARDGPAALNPGPGGMPGMSAGCLPPGMWYGMRQQAFRSFSLAPFRFSHLFCLPVWVPDLYVLYRCFVCRVLTFGLQNMNFAGKGAAGCRRAVCSRLVPQSRRERPQLTDAAHPGLGTGTGSTVGFPGRGRLPESRLLRLVPAL